MSDQLPAGSAEAKTSTSPADSIADPTSPHHPERAGPISHLNPRSCVTCRRRKVRCDKRYPCANCARQGIECVFPGPGRAPRKTRKPPDTELLSRLRRLEGVVKSLGAQVDEDGAITQPARAMSTIQSQLGGSSGRGSPEAEGTKSKRSSVDNHLGRLVINEGRSRYVSNTFWTSMGDEIAEMRDVLDAPSSEDEDDEFLSPKQSGTGAPSPGSHQAFVFGYSSLMMNLKKLHPSPSQVFILWEVFKENVDPLVRILHRPTAKNILMNASSNVDNLSKAAEALLFAIYFGAIVSMDELQCQSLLGEAKSLLVNRYRFATEQALARANFLNSSNLMVLQAFVYFLVCVRHQDDTRLVWALSGLATHIAQALGVHRDGTNFKLSPFETEMRRRLWWHISILDTRASEDHGTDPTFSETFYDTKLPMNINDEDISPEMKEWPRERQECTEMTFCLIRFELSATTRRMNFLPPGDDARLNQQQTLERKEKLIDECHKRIEEKYLQYCDMNVPIFWVSATVGRLVLAKMWLMAHHPVSFSNEPDGNVPDPEIKERLFITSVEVIEFSYLLERNENTSKWGWLFRTYMQWHAVAFVLFELCTRPLSSDYDRAWRAVESVYDHQVLGNPRNHKGMLWKPMRQLMTKAEAHRAEQLRVGNYMSSDRSGPRRPERALEVESPVTSIGLFPTTILHTAGEAFGMDFSDEPIMTSHDLADEPSRSAGDSAVSGPLTKSHEVQEWLTKEPPVLQDQDFLNWSGWDPGVGDFIVGGQPLNDFTMNGTQQEWY